MTLPPQDDQHPEHKPAIRPRQHLPCGPAGSPEHALRRLEESERLERALLHELAGLLDGSARFLRLARRELKDGTLTTVTAAAALSHLGAAESALQTMAAMIERTRERSHDRPDPCYIVAPQPVHIAIDAAIAHTQHLAAEHGIRIDTDIEISALSAPPLPLYPIIANALRNAIESHRASQTQDCPNPGIKIYAAVRDEPAHLDLSIVDNGPGIGEDLRRDPRLAFALGYTTRSGGSGIGLALCEDIVESLGGSICLEENEAGSGAVLRIRIPIRSVVDQAREAPR